MHIPRHIWQGGGRGTKGFRDKGGPTPSDARRVGHGLHRRERFEKRWLESAVRAAAELNGSPSLDVGRGRLASRTEPSRRTRHLPLRPPPPASARAFG